MTASKLVGLIVVLAVLIVGGHDAIQIADAKKNVKDTAGAAAGSAAQTIAASHGTATAKSAAVAVATRAGDVITKYSYDPVAATVTLTVAGSTSTWIVGRIDKSATDDITATAAARPAG